MKSKNFMFMVLMAFVFVFSSCGGGGGGDSSSTVSAPTTITGVFIDDPVEGLVYECSSGNEGVTNSKGEYTCNIDDSVTFTLGNVTLGETYSSSVITPYSLFPSDKDAAINLVRLLHSVDENGSAGQILIGKNFILPTDLNFSSPTFDSDVSSSVTNPLISAREAMLLLDDNIGRKSGTEIYHNGYWYNAMASSVTGRIWLDRDLGAKAVCSDYNDTACYGEFYQWGRDTDGHEKRDSLLSYSYPTDIDNAGNKFIIDTLDWIGYDGNGSVREKKWSNLNGESVCPVNFRVPTQQELIDENIIVADFTLNGVVTNVLKLSTAGERDLDRGIVREGEIGTYWTSESYERVVGGSWQYSFFPYSQYGPFKDIGYEGTRAIGKNVRCIRDLSVEKNGIRYGFITSSVTGKVWLDKNLGATRVCETFDDSECYGDYFQWGRDADGHEKVGAPESEMQESDIDSTSNNFIVNSNDWSVADASGALREAKWLKSDGTGICPIGFKVPTLYEIQAEKTYTMSEYFDKLKIPSAGTRSSKDEVNYPYGYVYQGQRVQLWSSTLISGQSWSVSAYETGGGSGASVFAYSHPVRCIED